MAWTAPYVWTTGEVVTAAQLNAQLKDNMRYLKGLDGAATFESDLTVDNLITAGNVDGVDVSAHNANTTTAHGAVSAATADKIVVRDAEGQAAFAAPAAAGDALIKGTRVTTAELPAMTDEFYWVGTGANVEERDVPTARTIATGNYTGDGNADRQIAVGFKCSFVLILDLTAPADTHAFFLIPNQSQTGSFSADVTAYIQLHATDGFNVRTGGGATVYGNTLNDVYYYWAISE